MTATVDRSTLVVCIGNELVADDAVGFEIFTRLDSMDLPKNVRLSYMGVGGIDLLDRLQGDEQAMIVVDAVQFGAPPGTIHQLAWDEIPANGNSAISAHGIGLKEAIEVGKLLCPEKLPAQITLFGIEGRCFNRMREYMTPETAAAIPKVVQSIERQLRSLHQGTDYEKE